MKRAYKAVSFALIVVCVLALVGCVGNQGALTINEGVEYEQKFGGVYITITIDDFNDKGFAFGDSVDITYSNGFSLTDIPYFSGFYVDMGEPLLVGYPGYPYVRAGYNNGENM